MATISSPGIGSGLDVTSIVTGLVAAEQDPYNARVAEQEEVITEKITSYGSLVSAAAAFEDAANALNSADLFNANSVTNSGSNFSVSVDADAVPSSYSIEVQSLAQGQKLASNTVYAEDQAVGEGTLTFTVNNSVMNLEFDGTETLSDMKDMINNADDNPGLYASIITGDNGQYLILNSKEVGVDNAISITASDSDGDNTDISGLSAFTAAPSVIDDSGKTAQLGSFENSFDFVGDGTLDFQFGVTGFSIDTTGMIFSELVDEVRTMAGVVSGTTGASINVSIANDSEGNLQLFLEGSDTITVTAMDSDGNNTDDSGISVFSFDPTTDAQTKGGVVAGTGNMEETQAASDAVIIIDGSLTVTQSSNVFTDAIEGVSITVTSVNEPDESNTISISQDTSQVGAALADFAAAYNTFLETSITLGRVNTDSNIVGGLVGESVLRNLTSQVRNILSATIDTDSNVNSLASLGFVTNQEGLLEVDETVLASQVTDNFDDVKKLFIGEDGESGIMTDLTESLSAYTGDGIIQNKIDSYNTSLERLTTDQEDFTAKMTAFEERLYAQFNAMDLLVASLQSTGDFLTGQLDSLPGVVSSN